MKRARADARAHERPLHSTSRTGAPMSNTAPRIPPLPPAEWTAEVRDFFAIIEGPEAREKGSKFNIILTFAHHPMMAGAFNNYYKTFLSNSTLSLRAARNHHSARRLAPSIRIRVDAACGDRKGAGLSDEQIEAIRHERRDARLVGPRTALHSGSRRARLAVTNRGRDVGGIEQATQSKADHGAAIHRRLVHVAVLRRQFHGCAARAS